jgi:hypothetical protein
MKKIFYIFISIFTLITGLFAQPQIYSFSPTSGSIGTLVTINGNNLSNIDTVKIGGAAAIKISKTNSTLVAMVMPGANTGAIYIANSTFGNATSSSNFTKVNSIAPNTQQGNKLVGTGGVGNSLWQGSSVSISADGNTAIVGASKDSSNRGASWIYIRTGNTWTQQGNKLVGTGYIGNSKQGESVGLSADGNTAIVCGSGDNNSIGASWIFTRTGTTWTQQGNKLVGTSYVGGSIYQGSSVSLSADGNTAIVGGSGDSNGRGASWIFTRTGTTWTQQGNKLVGTGSVGQSRQGNSVCLSADGNTAIVGGFIDSSGRGASWIFTRIGNSWTQQGNKLVGTGFVGNSNQGRSVSLSANGNTAIVGGSSDLSSVGASWVFIRIGNIWTQQGNKLVGTGYVGSYIYQGTSVSLSADGNTAIVGGSSDLSSIGASWVFIRTGTTWAQQGNKLVGSAYVGGSFQGSSVSLSSDGNTAIVGGYQDNGNIGAAWVFNGISGITATSNMIGFNSCSGIVSSIQSFMVSGILNNTDSLLITAPAGFEIYNSSVSGFTNSIKLKPISGIINSTAIYVRLTSLAVGSPNGNIVCSAPNAISQNISVSGIVRPKPFIGFRVNNQIQCLNRNSFIFTDTSTISSGTFTRKWNFGNGISDTSLLANPTKIYSTANTFSIKLLATSSYGCKDSITKTITVNPSPVASCTINNWQQCLSNNNIICTETSTISSGSITKRIWQVYNASNGNTVDTSTNSIYNKVFTSPGNYSILLISESNNGCRDTTQKDFGIYQLDATTSFTKNTICSANGTGTASILVTNGTSPYTYLWGSNANSQTTQTATGLKEDTYQVIATDSNNCSIAKSIKVLNIPNVNTQVPITNIAMLDQSSAANFIQYYNYDLPLSINSNSNNPKNYADAGKYFRFKIQSKNSKLNGQSIVNGFCKVRSNSPYVTITDSIAALNNIAYNGKVWSADEFEVYINPTTPKGSNLYLDFVVEESATNFSTGCLSIPIAPLNYSTNTALTIDDDNNPDSKGNNNDTCELGETIEFYPWLNNVSDKKAQYVKGTLLNNNNFAGVNIWNNIKGVNDTVMNNTWWNLAFGKPTSIDTGSIESKPAMDFVFDYSYGAPRNNFDLNLAVAAGFNLLSDTTLSLVQWSLPYNFKSEFGAADVLQVNPQTINNTSLGGINKVAVSSNRSWVVTSNQSWVTLNKNTGIGNDSINIMVAANTGLSRTALITFIAGLITKTLTINQDSFTTADILSLDKDSINTSFGASLNTVQVSSNRSWTVSSNQSWCGVSTVTGSGNGSFNVINSINNTGLFRNAFVTVTAGSITKNVYVGQSASVGFNNTIINNKQISLYPNPNNGNFTIQLKNTADKNGTIIIVDMLGRIVYETLYKLNNNEDIISISDMHLKAGTYSIIIGNKDGAATRKSFVVIGE